MTVKGGHSLSGQAATSIGGKGKRTMGRGNQLQCKCLSKRRKCSTPKRKELLENGREGNLELRRSKGIASVVIKKSGEKGLRGAIIPQ